MRNDEKGIIIDGRGTRRIQGVDIPASEWARVKSRLELETQASSHASLIEQLLASLRSIRKSDRRNLRIKPEKWR